MAKTIPAGEIMVLAKRPDADFESAPVKDLRLPWPPSVNKIWRVRRSGSYLSERARGYRQQAGFAVMLARQAGRLPKVPMEGDVAVRLVFCPPDKRPRDLDNLPKSVFDALTHSGVWQDDRQVRLIESWYGPRVKSGACIVSISSLEPSHE